MDAPGRTALIDPCRSTWTLVVVSFLLSLLIPATGSAQSAENNPWFVRSGVNPSYIFSANPYANPNHPGGPIHWGQNLTYEIGRQTDGKQPWHQLYGVPSYGFGFSLASFRNDVEHARPREAYTFFSWPLVHVTDRIDMTTEFGMGMSWHWQEVTDDAKSYETSLGSNLNARINWGFYLRSVVTPQFTLFTGVDYTHRSNGGMVQPDRGINVIGPKVTLQYSFAPEPVKRRFIKAPPFHPSWEFIAGGTGGVKNVIERKDPLTRSNYLVARRDHRATASVLSVRQDRGRRRPGVRRGNRRQNRRQRHEMAGRRRPAVGGRLVRRLRAHHRPVQRPRAGWRERGARIRRS